MFRVTNKYARGSEQELRKFPTVEEAKNFIADELSNAAALKVNVVFRLYKDIDLIEEFDPYGANPSLAKAEDSSSAGKGSAASFRPSPFNTSPRPSSSPKSWLPDEDDNKKK